MSYERLEEAEPTVLIGTLASLIGFVALLGADVGTLQSAGTALGVGGTQALLTRQGVYSPKSIREVKSGPASAIPFGELLSSGGMARQQEPALAIGMATVLGGFLVQYFAGVGLTESLVSAGGIAGAQSVTTRNRVYSPQSARRIATARLLAESPLDASRVMDARTLPNNVQPPPSQNLFTRLREKLEQVIPFAGRVRL
jgi:hypothetical protein